jgi:glycosyltransferase involved in cell wall biosynthesis
LHGLDSAIWAPDESAVCQTSRVETEAGPHAIALHGSLSQALSTFGTPDIFHDSGLWWRHNRMIAATARRRGRPVVVSVRGMLEPAALNHRAWKKRLAWHFYQRHNLEKAAALHVTSDLEAKSVRALGLRSKIACIPNGISVPAQCPVRDLTRPKRMVFLGRLHPIKGLPMLLEAWARIRPTDWFLEITGPDEGGYRRRLEDQVEALNLNGTVCFTAPVGGAEKKALLARASVLVLPSYSENFGVAAGEALAEGLPVIATHGTPWAALESEGCGWHVATNVDGLERGLRNAFAAPQQQLTEMGRRGHAFAARAFSWNRVAGEMVALYQNILATNDRTGWN